MKNQIESRQEQIENLKKELESSKQTINNCQTTAIHEEKNHQQQITSLQKQIKQLTDDKIREQNQNQTLKTSAERYETLIGEYRRTIDHLSDENTKLSKNLKIQQEQIDLLENHLTEYQSDTTNLAEALTSTSQESQTKEQQLSSCYQEISSLKHKINELEQNILLVEKSKETLQHSLNLREESLQTLTNSKNSQSKAHQESIHSLEQQLLSSHHKIQYLEQQIEENRRELEGKERTIREWTKRYQLLESQRIHLSEELNLSSKALYTTQERNVALKEQLNEYRQQYEDRLHQVKSNAQQAATQASEEYQNLYCRVVKLQANIHEIQRERQLFQSQVEDLIRYCIDHQLAKISEIFYELDTSDISSLPWLNRFESPCDSSISKLWICIQQQSQKIMEQNSKISDDITKIQHLEQLHQEDINQKDKLETDLSNKSNAIKKLSEKLQKLETMSHKEQSHTAQLEVCLMQELKKIRSENIELQNSIYQLEIKNNNANNEISTLQNSLEELQEEHNQLLNRAHNFQQLLKATKLTLLRESELNEQSQMEEEEEHQKSLDELNMLYSLKKSYSTTFKAYEAKLQHQQILYNEIENQLLLEKEYSSKYKEICFDNEQLQNTIDELEQEINSLQEQLSDANINLEIQQQIAEEEKKLLLIQLRNDSSLLQYSP